jgi:hypothetical protein
LLYCKDRFLRVERYVELATSFQDNPKVRQVIFLVFRKDGDIIKIDHTDWLMRPQKAISIALWKVAPTFISPKGIFL